MQNTTVTARARNFHSVQYLLVHGTADGEQHKASMFVSVYYFIILGGNISLKLNNNKCESLFFIRCDRIHLQPCLFKQEVLDAFLIAIS